MRNACDSDSCCGLASDASARDAKSLRAMRTAKFPHWRPPFGNPQCLRMAMRDFDAISSSDVMLYPCCIAGPDSLWNFVSTYEERSSLGQDRPGCAVGGISKNDSQTGVEFSLCGLHRPDIFRAARLQDETAPETFLYRYEEGFEEPEKGSEKQSETWEKMFKPVSRRFKFSHWHFSKSSLPLF